MYNLPTQHPQLAQQTTAYKQIWAFLATLQGHAASTTQPGITWLELAALFVARGGNLTPTC